ncbi:hypothetical protein FTX61_16875 [Nitriliruptoraceae bacterium ZYF776]|nr:hypothetical protein [Profundirhabdus halotolerans]
MVEGASFDVEKVRYQPHSGSVEGARRRRSDPWRSPRPPPRRGTGMAAAVGYVGVPGHVGRAPGAPRLRRLGTVGAERRGSFAPQRGAEENRLQAWLRAQIDDVADWLRDELAHAERDGDREQRLAKLREVIAAVEQLG